MADLSDSANWFELDGSNNRPPPNGWPEGMMPSGVNDTARGDKGALKRFWDRVNPVQTVTPVLVGGITNTWTFTTSNTAYPAAYVNGEVYCFKAGAAAAGGDQFQVNVLDAKPIQKRVGAAWAALVPGDIQSGTAPQLIYDSSLVAGAGAFILLNPYIAAASDGAGGTTLSGSLAVGGDIHAAGSVYLGGDYVFFNGNTSGSQGPFIALDGTNAVSRLGPGGGAFYFENNAGTPLATINNGGDLGQLGPYIYLNNSSGIVNAAGGPLIYGDGNWFMVKPGSGNQGFMVQDYNGNNRFQVSGDGHLTNNGHSFAFCGGGYNQLYDAAGNVSVFLGSGTNFYRNTTHAFQTIGGGATQMSLDGSGNANIAGTLTVNGNISGAQVFIGGIQLFNNGGWLQSPNIRASNALYTDGNATVAGVISSNDAHLNVGTIGGVTFPGGGTVSSVGNLSCQGITASGNLGGNLGIHASYAIQSDLGGTAFYAPNGQFVGAGVNVSGNITTGGQGFKPGGGPWADTSDIRTKEDVRDYTSGLPEITALRCVTFGFNGRGGTVRDGRRYVGLIADEVLPIMPEMVGTTSNLLDPEDDAPTEIKTIDATALTFASVNAIRELAAQLATLENAVSELAARLATLEAE